MSSTQATVNELIAGSFGGAAQVLVGQPLDTIKTRAQVAPSVCLNIFRVYFVESFQRRRNVRKSENACNKGFPIALLLLGVD